MSLDSTFNEAKIELYKNGKYSINEVGDAAIKETTVNFAADPASLSNARFIIVAVSTPINDDHTLNLTPIESVYQSLRGSLP